MTPALTSRLSGEYMPHPAPEHQQADKMGATTSLLKTLVIPAAISLGLYFFLSYLIIPLWQKYRGRYSRYIPLETISSHTGSLRQRVQSAVARFLLPSSWRSNPPTRFVVSASAGPDNNFDEDEGEELYEVDRRREALSLDARRGQDDRRLSRDLEEGFRDDSDDEDDEDERDD